MQLPRRQRNDVAFELRALINEGLQDRAEAAGRGVDAAMAIEFLRGFGRPEDVAARYLPTLTIIDPADGRRFLRATFIGLAIIWCLGLARLQPSIDSGWDVLQALGQWWGATVIPSLWWPGVLVAWFGTAAWVGRRWPPSSEWKPRAGDRIGGNRATMVLGLVAMLGGLFVLTDPRWVLDFFWDGRAAPAAYEALTYTETFLHRQAPWVLAIIVLNILLYVALTVQGRRSAIMRRAETALSLATCAVLAWTAMDGPVFMAPASDDAFKLGLVLIIAFTVASIGIGLYRRVSPAPDRQT